MSGNTVSRAAGDGPRGLVPPEARHASWLGAGALVALAVIGSSLLGFESYAQRPVLGRWSYPLAAAIVAVWATFALVLRLVRSGALAARLGDPPPLHLRALDAALAAWGLAYAVGTLDNVGAAARVLDFVLFGAEAPLAACLEWVALALFAVAVVGALVRGAGRRRLDVAAAVGSTLGVLLLLEAAARGKALRLSEPQGFPTYSGRQWFRRHVSLNADGFRDVAHERAKPAGIRRLLVIGDSYAFGWGLERTADRFGEQVAARLTTATGTQWEPLNASRGDSHTLHHQGFARRMLVYRPDLVALIYVFNDIDYLAPVTSRVGVSESPAGAIRRLSPMRLLFANSYAFQECYVRLRALQIARAAAGSTLASPYADSALMARHLDDVRAVVRLAESSGAAAVIVPFDVAIASGGEAAARYERFVRAARTSSLPVVDLSPAFARRSFDGLTLNALDRHPNVLANRLAAEASLVPLLSVVGMPGSAASRRSAPAVAGP